MFRYLLCSFALVLLYPTGIDLYLVGLPQIALDLQASEAQLHIAFSVYLGGMATTMFFAGNLSDKIGRKPIVLMGAVIFALASALGGFADSANAFLATRFVQGIGAGACYVVAFAILRDVLDDARRAKVLSMINGITCVVPVLAPVAGHLIMLVYPWPTLFTVMSAMGVLVGLISLFGLKETRVAEANINDSTNHNSQETESLLQPFFVRRVIMASLAVGAILSYVNASPLMLMETLGFSRGGYSSVMACTALASMITSFSAPILLRYVSQARMLLCSQTLLLIAAILLMSVWSGVVDNRWMLLAFGLVCVGFASGFGIIMSQALSPFSERAGAASSVLGISQVCFSATYIWFMGVIGLSGIEMLLVAVLLAGAGGMLLSRRSSPCDQHNEKVSRAS
ncbi:MFS transporter [Vibrio sp. SM6]|uniref:MFS transporter n=1 Tax=Vibrio agarilyticus TaxID=2726741 RepID=A0A7X8YG95_9VIBR|nr:MFS transporter [Vibrio agarilyticus]NLS12176.1 MFS transporter [Vibrio agarilyticus]